MSEFKIRPRTMRGWIREVQRYGTWNEVQVWCGRKIVSRHDTTEQAEAWIAAQSPTHPTTR